MVEKAVLDTSVIISGLVGSGSSNEVLRRVLTGRLRIILSAEIFKEYLKAVHYPRLRIPSLYAYAVLSRIHALSEMVSPQSRIRICRDPEDDKFLEAAYEAKANFIITLNHDLTDLRNPSTRDLTIYDYKVKILTPKEFLQIQRERRDI